MLTLISHYILHNTGVVRVADVSKDLAASNVGVVQEDQDTNFFETSATRLSAHFEIPNRWSKITMKCHANFQQLIFYYNPTK
jgi:hypothetical protein